LQLVLSAVFIPPHFFLASRQVVSTVSRSRLLSSVIFSAVQRALAEPGAFSHAARGRVKKTRGPVGWFFDRCQSCLWQGNTRLCELVTASRSEKVSSVSVCLLPSERGGRAPGVSFFVWIAITERLFYPRKIQGYIYLALQLPDAASLERTDQACRKIEDFLSKTPGVQYTTSVIGFSLLSLVQNTLQRVLLRYTSNRGASAQNRKNNIRQSRRA